MLTETVTLQTLLGHATLERERVATVELPAEAAGAATRLRLPFSSLTPSIKDELKALGFRCHHTDRFWELPASAYSEHRESALRHLLLTGTLPGGVGSSRHPHHADTPTKGGERKHKWDDSFGGGGSGGGGGGSGGSGGIGSPRAAAAAHMQAMQLGGGQQQEEEREQGPPQPSADAAEAGEAAAAEEEGAEPGVVSLHEGSAAHVTMRRDADGHLLLDGAGLWNIRPMLERLLHFSEVPVSAGSAACSGVGAPQPRWRSAWPLGDAEQAFVEALLEHRKRSLRHASHDDREPIPLGVVVPPRFRPRSRDGLAMRGPMLCKGGSPHNIGRQLFVPVSRENGGGILWADGTEPSTDKEQARFNEWELAELGDREDWEEDVPQESQEGDWGDAGGEGEGVDADFYD